VYFVHHGDFGFLLRAELFFDLVDVPEVVLGFGFQISDLMLDPRHGLPQELGFVLLAYLLNCPAYVLLAHILP
jgi:hypothetical protein